MQNHQMHQLRELSLQYRYRQDLSIDLSISDLQRFEIGVRRVQEWRDEIEGAADEEKCEIGAGEKDVVDQRKGSGVGIGFPSRPKLRRNRQ